MMIDLQRIAHHADRIHILLQMGLCRSQMGNYVWTSWYKYIKFCMDLDTFIIPCPGLFLPEFLSNRLQTLAQ